MIICQVIQSLQVLTFFKLHSFIVRGDDLWNIERPTTFESIFLLVENSLLRSAVFCSALLAFELFELSSQGLGGGLRRQRLAGGEWEVQATTSRDWVDYCLFTKLKKQ